MQHTASTMHTVYQMIAITAMVLSVTTLPIRTDNVTDPPQFHDPALEMFLYNVPTILHDTATHDPDFKYHPITEEQVQAVIAAASAPHKLPPEIDLPDPKSYYDPAEKHRLDNIYQVMNANFSLLEIHKLFHDENDEPIRLTDEQVDAAIAAHSSNITNLTKGGRDRTNHTPILLPAESITQFLKYNVSWAHINSSTVTQRLLTLPLIQREVDAIIAADSSPVRQNKSNSQSENMQRQHVYQIFRIMDAKLSLKEIRKLFHSEDGMPIFLTDEQVDMAIAGHTGLLTRSVEDEISYDHAEPLREMEQENQMLGHNVGIEQQCAAGNTKNDYADLRGDEE